MPQLNQKDLKPFAFLEQNPVFFLPDFSFAEL
jgi:hypothetical protein